MDGNGCSIGTHILSYKPKYIAGGHAALSGSGRDAPDWVI